MEEMVIKGLVGINQMTALLETKFKEVCWCIEDACHLISYVSYQSLIVDYYSFSKYTSFPVWIAKPYYRHLLNPQNPPVIYTEIVLGELLLQFLAEHT